MAVSPVGRRDHRIARAPPPTPIATWKGLRSAAVDDRVLAEYLENTLKIPELTLPDTNFPARSPNKIPPEIEFPSLASGDAASIRRLLAAAAEVGAFRINGHGVEEVRSAIEVGGGVFGIPEERKRDLGGCFGQEDGIGEEFYWHRTIESEIETVLDEAWPESYRIFREKMKSTTSKLEIVAELISQILFEHVRIQSHSTRIHKMHSVICLRKCDNSHLLKRDRIESMIASEFRHSHILSLHLSGADHKFCFQSPEVSASFSLPTGSILVTIGKQLQEWSNGQFRSSTRELVHESSDDMTTCFSVEFICSLPASSHKANHSTTKTVSILDQLLIVLALAFLCNLWPCIIYSSNS